MKSLCSLYERPISGHRPAGYGDQEGTLERRAREGGIWSVEWGKEVPPDPELFDGTPPARQAAGKRVQLLCVGADNHLAEEYAPHSPGCHRTCRLFAAGNSG
jgi:hypothetical protein